jgi:nitrite reductase/ring-hydroxylating ferredoxin subunit
VLTALPTAASGAYDWLDTDAAEQRVGVAHGLFNTAATGLFALSWWQRRRGRHGVGTALGLAGGAAMTAGGFLGGDLSYRRGVGVNTTAFQSGPVDWKPLLAVARLASGLPQGVVVDGVALVAVPGAPPRPRPEDGGSDDHGHPGESRPSEGRDEVVAPVSVLESRCTHRGGPLDEGRVERRTSGGGGDCIVCPWHLSRFRLEDGSVATGPASVPQPVYETRVRDGMVEVRRDEPGALRRNILPAELDLPVAPLP